MYKRQPNPCIDCNRYMKFDHLLRWAESHGMEYVVTGHYARVEQDEAKMCIRDREYAHRHG